MKQQETNLCPLIILPFMALLAILTAQLLSIFGSSFNDKPIKKSCQETYTFVVIDGTDWELAISHIKQCEGFSSTPYKLGTNYFIGYGHLLNDTAIKKISEEQAETYLRNDLLQCIQYASETFNLLGSQALSVGMLYYGASPTAISHSGLRRALCENDTLAIKNSWSSICKFNGKVHQGLLQRRNFEIRLFFGK